MIVANGVCLFVAPPPKGFLKPDQSVNIDINAHLFFEFPNQCICAGFAPRDMAARQSELSIIDASLNQDSSVDKQNPCTAKAMYPVVFDK
jgi:hypothetical protein